MKKIMNIKLVALCVAATAVGFTSCSEAFLEEKKDQNLVSSIVYDDYTGAKGRVNDIYAWSLNGAYSLDDKRGGLNYGGSDDLSKSTEEYAGLSKWVNPTVNMQTTNYVGENFNFDYFHGGANNVQTQVWGRIRNINDVISGIENSLMKQSEKDELVGQVYFWRAWAYYQLFKWYGGVPIITEVLPPVEGAGTPRSSAREVFEFICSDLDKAATLLEVATANGGWAKQEDWGRVTVASALALKGRVMNLWASPMFNRKNEAARWEAAYSFMKEAKAKIDACGHSLVDAQAQTAAGWADMFARTDRNPEAVLVQLYNTHDRNPEATENIGLNNGWEQAIRPKNTYGNGGHQPSQMMIDLFPMSDGKVPAVASNYTSLGTSEIEYDELCPWMNRDPRFYRTFAFPGVRWTFSGDPSASNSNYWQNGANYELWSYVWYLKDDASKIGEFRSSSNHGPDGLNGSAKGFYVRKRTCDGDVSAQNYVWNNTFRASAAPFMEIRYAEVVLNMAEAAAMTNNVTEAVNLLRSLRQRVGYTGDCGISDGMTQQQAVAAVLYERMIELAYEGKRFDDMRRWMLFDGGATLPEGAPSTWAVDGWGGNTCNWLGIAPLNGKRRENYEFHITYDAGMGAGIGEDLNNGDPLTNVAGIARPAAIDFRNEGEVLTAQMDAVKKFYTDYLACKIYSGDSYDGETQLNYVITWRPHYYFLGLVAGAQNNNKALPQTIGWEDNQTNAMGTFDPLADNAE